MSSILTNKSAMVALQTLRGINMNLAKAQAQISTGMKVANAKDSASIWAISKVMQSDVKGFKGISDSLGLGESTVAVARQAAETISDLLTDIKGKVVAAQEQNVDRSKIQTDIKALRDQIKSVVNAAQFNGLNLLKGTDHVEVLSSLDRAGDGTVSASNIVVNRQDLSMDAGALGAGATLVANGTLSAAAATNTGNSETITIAADADMSDNVISVTVGTETLTYNAGDLSGDQDAAASTISGAINALSITGISASAAGGVITVTSTVAFSAVALSATGATASATSIAERAETLTFSNSAQVANGDGYRLTVGSIDATYVAGPAETFEDVAKGLKTAIDSKGIAGISTAVAQDATTGAWIVKVDNDTATSASLVLTANAGGTASGGLFGLDSLDVTTNEGADRALDNVETWIDNSIDAAAEFGSVQGRIEIQRDFISNLTDSLKSGIGTLIDADMEEASARLQALQVQQQLGIQSLSIANQSPQSILSLFR